MALTRYQKKSLSTLFKRFPEIQLVYLFGSRARGDAVQASDHDFAIYVDPKKKKRAFDILLELSAKIGSILKSDNYDVVIINLTNNIIMKNNIVNQGVVIYEKPGVRLDLELAIVGEYRDFRILERQYFPD